jgi:hypothetical protein
VGHQKDVNGLLMKRSIQQAGIEIDWVHAEAQRMSVFNIAVPPPNLNADHHRSYRAM